MISARTGFDFPFDLGAVELRWWTIGREKAAVFPVPVWAQPKRSFPSKTIGIDRSFE